MAVDETLHVMHSSSGRYSMGEWAKMSLCYVVASSARVVPMQAGLAWGVPAVIDFGGPKMLGRALKAQ
jgi:hypothetical protein